ncbi:hypothetical protein NPIL_316571 [Nephila pilipes]|uniref:Uncharacterized protein n=1 Tax=Nephila pilipes TaxID=299642 RepID=A0A8X6QIG7_NEPPI|nr:hypothetical protein NPIL_316571 [Nephila pilipes]
MPSELDPTIRQKQMQSQTCDQDLRHSHKHSLHRRVERSQSLTLVGLVTELGGRCGGTTSGAIFSEHEEPFVPLAPAHIKRVQNVAAESSD